MSAVLWPSSLPVHPPQLGLQTLPPDLAQSLLSSFTMICLSELGDKTFFIAALLAMRHARMTVFLGAGSALLVMSILSAMLGQMFPTVLPRCWVGACAAVLFTGFAVKLAMEARGMRDGDAGAEMEQVERELLLRETRARDREEGRAGVIVAVEDVKRQFLTTVATSKASLRRHHSITWTIQSAGRYLRRSVSTAYLQAFVMVFLAEWGDRSQIATIALSATQDAVSVALGTILGHLACTALAVVGGRVIASRISMRGVTILGAVLFAVFAVAYGVDAVVSGGDACRVPF